MADEKKHEIDAEIPTETSQFDAIAEQQGEPVDPMMKEATEALMLQINRTKHLAQAFLNHKGQAVNMIGENYINQALDRAELVVISKLLEEKLGVSPADYVKAVVEQMDQMLQLKQMEYKIIITTDGVINDAG